MCYVRWIIFMFQMHYPDEMHYPLRLMFESSHILKEVLLHGGVAQKSAFFHFIIIFSIRRKFTFPIVCISGSIQQWERSCGRSFLFWLSSPFHHIELKLTIVDCGQISLINWFNSIISHKSWTIWDKLKNFFFPRIFIYFYQSIS